MLFVVLYSRRDVAEACAAADKALALNPYDMLTLAEYGGRLIMIGEIDRGMAMLRRATEYGSIRPSWHHFYMFSGSLSRRRRARGECASASDIPRRRCGARPGGAGCLPRGPRASQDEVQEGGRAADRAWVRRWRQRPACSSSRG